MDDCYIVVQIYSWSWSSSPWKEQVPVHEPCLFPRHKVWGSFPALSLIPGQGIYSHMVSALSPKADQATLIILNLEKPKITKEHQPPIRLNKKPAVQAEI